MWHVEPLLGNDCEIRNYIIDIVSNGSAEKYISMAIIALQKRNGVFCAVRAGPRQRSLSRVRVPSDSWQNFTVSDLKLPFSSPPTTRGVSMEVFEPASTRV
jgi:hypothetical protein